MFAIAIYGRNRAILGDAINEYGSVDAVYYLGGSFPLPQFTTKRNCYDYDILEHWIVVGLLLCLRFERNMIVVVYCLDTS